MSQTDQAGWITLTSLSDGFELSAWRVPAKGARKGGLVLIQEIFGVTDDLKRVCADFANDGYEVICPSLFDRMAPRVALGHDTDDDFAEARKYSSAKPKSEAIGDLQAAINHLAPAGPVFMTGFCYGGALTWLGACLCTGLAAASGYYGRAVFEHPDEIPRCPVILHFGRNDPYIPMTQVNMFMEARPEIPVFIYEAGHGFVSHRSADFSAEATALARTRTLALFAENA